MACVVRGQAQGTVGDKGRGRVPPACGTLLVVKTARVIERINELLDSSDPETTNTSMRLPASLRDAAALAVNELGVAPSTTALTSAALRATLEAIVMQA